MGMSRKKREAAKQQERREADAFFDEMVEAFRVRAERAADEPELHAAVCGEFYASLVFLFGRDFALSWMADYQAGKG